MRIVQGDRFVKLDVATLKRVSPLFDEVLELDRSQREGWLARLECTQADLAPIVRELLARESLVETNDFLERGPGFAAPTQDARGTEFVSGVAVGPYRLIREIGVGGMGEVWLAEREDGVLKRTVALKLPMITLKRSVLVQRFARERDILATLAHPNIARLYDAGLSDGQPYLALEYVEGQQITAYADQHDLGTKARIGLLRQVMDAVQYAHANLVIHRDLKPGNVLVTTEGKALLLDFGIAKLLEEDASHANETELTRLGGRALTLQYAAPEQVAGEAISIATDIWALGVLLYELLTGLRPFEPMDRATLEQNVLNSDPVRPSQRKAGAISKLPRGIATELDTIVLKALKKAPVERYGTVSAFADDLDRWINGEPVLAQPDSTWYRARKFVGRHKVAVTAGLLGLSVLLATGAVALWQATQAKQQAALAQQEAARAQAVQGFLLDLFTANRSTQADPQAAQATTARELLDRGAARIDQALTDQPQSRIDVMATLAEMYSQLALEKQAADLQARRAELARKTWGTQDPRLAQLLLDQIETLQDSDRRGDIPALLDEALAILRRSPGADQALQGDALIVAARYWRYESLSKSRQGADQAAAYLSQHLPQSDALVTAHLLASRGALNAGDADAGEAHARLAIAAARRQGDGASAWRATPTGALADALYLQLKINAAEAEHREQLALTTHVHGDLHPDTLSARVRLGNLMLSLGRGAEGLAQHEAVRKALSSSDPRYTTEWRSYTASVMGSTLLDRGRPDLLVPLLRADLVILQRTLPRAPLRANRERVLAEVLAAQGNIEAARKSLAAASEHWAQFAEGADAPHVESLFALSQARIELAAANPAAALALLAPQRPATAIDALARQVERAHALLQLGQAAAAVADADAALRTLDAMAANNRPLAIHASALEWRGLARRALGDIATARADLQQALSLRRSHDMPASIHVARIARELAATPPHGAAAR
jgi:serine/threonine-protein kinase